MTPYLAQGAATGIEDSAILGLLEEYPTKETLPKFSMHASSSALSAQQRSPVHLSNRDILRGCQMARNKGIGTSTSLATPESGRAIGIYAARGSSWMSYSGVMRMKN